MCSCHATTVACDKGVLSTPMPSVSGDGDQVELCSPVPPVTPDVPSQTSGSSCRRRHRAETARLLRVQQQRLQLAHSATRVRLMYIDRTFCQLLWHCWWLWWFQWMRGGQGGRDGYFH